jgi:hypothetical protein
MKVSNVDTKIARPVDVVTIRTENNPFTQSVKINGVCVIGSAAPCDKFLVNGERVKPAVRCLLRNGFKLIAERRNVLVFRRVPS